MSWIAARLLSSLFAGEPQTAPPPPGPPPVCQNTGYAGVRQPVETADAAKAIFLTVEQDLFPAADRTGFPRVEAQPDPEDAGAWIVVRMRASEPGRSQRGGGQLELRIARCDGSVLVRSLSR